MTIDDLIDDDGTVSQSAMVAAAARIGSFITETEADALRAEMAELRKQLNSRSAPVKKPFRGTGACKETIAAEFFLHPHARANQCYRIDPHSTMALHDWPYGYVMNKPADGWSMGSVEHRTSVSLLNRASFATGETVTNRMFMDLYGERDVAELII